MAAIRAALTDPALTPEGLCLKMFDDMARLDVPEQRSAAFADNLKQTAAFIRQQRTNAAVQTALVREMAQFHGTALALARPIQPPTVSQVIRQIYGPLQDEFDWSSLLLELAEQELKPDDLPIKSFDATSITTQTRTVTKEFLLKRYQPINMTSDRVAAWRKSMVRPEFLRTHLTTSTASADAK